MVKTYASTLVILFVLMGLLRLVATPAADAITVDVYPKIALSTATLRISVRVKPATTNRGVTIRIDSPNYYRSSFDPDFTGIDSPITGTYFYEIRDPGQYAISAILHRAAPDRDVSATTTMCLSGLDVEC